MLCLDRRYLHELIAFFFFFQELFIWGERDRELKQGEEKLGKDRGRERESSSRLPSECGA